MRKYVVIIQHVDAVEMEENINLTLEEFEESGRELIDIKYSVVLDEDNELMHSALIVYKHIIKEEKDELEK